MGSTIEISKTKSNSFFADLFPFLHLFELVLDFGHSSSMFDQIDARVLLERNLLGFGQKLPVWLALSPSLDLFGVNQRHSRVRLAHVASK